MKRALAPVIIGLVALAGCSSANNEAAQQAYDACHEPDAELELIHLDGSSVQIVVDGDAARAMAGTGDELDQILAGGDFDEGLTGFAVSASMLVSIECLTEATGYPGSSEQLTDGDEWDGWEYSYEEGAGSSFTAAFTATG